MAALPPKKWTVLVYMGADDRDDAEMVTSAFRDLEEMRNIKSSDHMNIAVQLDLKLFKPVRFLIDQGGFLDTSSRGLGVLRESSTGRPTTLQKFLDWALHNARADHYLLILWGHGLGVGHSVEEAEPASLADVVFDADDGLTVRELGRVLRRFQGERGTPLELLGFDACYMSSAEIGYEYRDLAQFMVGSQIVIPMQGWPYIPVLRLLRRRPRSTAKHVARSLVRSFVKSYPQGKTVTQTAVNPPASDDVRTAVSMLTAALNQAADDRDEVRAIRGAFKAAKFVDARQFVDLKDLCHCLAGASRNRDVKAAARATASKLKTGPNTFVLEHRRRGPGGKRLYGLSVYVRWLKAKPGGSQYDVKIAHKEYTRLEFVKKTGWQRFHDRFGRIVARSH